MSRYPCRFSPDRVYRYTWQDLWLPANGVLMVIGLNPSTADEWHRDPTVTRCVNFAKRLLYGGLIMTNAFALRGTDPQILKAFPTRPDMAVGPDNDRWLLAAANEATTVLAAWGNHGLLYDRQEEILTLLADKRIWCLGVTKDGAPKHPLYLPAATEPVVFRGPRIPGQEDDGYAD